MSDMDIILWIELRSEYVDTAGVKRHAGVEVIADHLELRGEQIIATRHSSPVFTAQHSDVIGVHITGQTAAAPPRFTDRDGQPWTSEEDDALRELSTDGVSVGKMAYELGRGPVEVHKRVSRLDLPLPRP